MRAWILAVAAVLVGCSDRSNQGPSVEGRLSQAGCYFTEKVEGPSWERTRTLSLNCEPFSEGAQKAVSSDFNSGLAQDLAVFEAALKYKYEQRSALQAYESVADSDRAYLVRGVRTQLDANIAKLESQRSQLRSKVNEGVEKLQSRLRRFEKGKADFEAARADLETRGLSIHFTEEPAFYFFPSSKERTRAQRTELLGEAKNALDAYVETYVQDFLPDDAIQKFAPYAQISSSELDVQIALAMIDYAPSEQEFKKAAGEKVTPALQAQLQVRGAYWASQNDEAFSQYELAVFELRARGLFPFRVEIEKGKPSYVFNPKAISKLNSVQLERAKAHFRKLGDAAQKLIRAPQAPEFTYYADLASSELLNRLFAISEQVAEKEADIVDAEALLHVLADASYISEFKSKLNLGGNMSTLMFNEGWQRLGAMAHLWMDSGFSKEMGLNAEDEKLLIQISKLYKKDVFPVFGPDDKEQLKLLREADYLRIKDRLL